MFSRVLAVTWLVLALMPHHASGVGLFGEIDRTERMIRKFQKDVKITIQNGLLKSPLKMKREMRVALRKCPKLLQKRTAYLIAEMADRRAKLITSGKNKWKEITSPKYNVKQMSGNRIDLQTLLKVGPSLLKSIEFYKSLKWIVDAVDDTVKATLDSAHLRLQINLSDIENYKEDIKEYLEGQRKSFYKKGRGRKLSYEQALNGFLKHVHSRTKDHTKVRYDNREFTPRLTRKSLRDFCRRHFENCYIDQLFDEAWKHYYVGHIVNA